MACAAYTGGPHPIHRATMPVQGDITTIDTGYVRPGLCAAYLLMEGGRATFIDTGPGRALPRLLSALEARGLPRSAVDWVIVTHVHLDHAGGAGALLRELPNARLVVHPRGARHMIDPSRLEAGARAVYGDAEYRRHHDPLVPVPAERVVVAVDGHVVDLAGRRLLCADTPGHASHHLCVWDARSRSWFTGDTFGISYRGLDTTAGAFAIPSSSPVQFDPDALRRSIHRLLAEAPEAMYLAHYGCVTGAQRIGAELIAQIDAMVDLAHRCDGRVDRRERLLEGLERLYVQRAQRHGVADAHAAVASLLALDIQLNVQGLEVWLDRIRQQAGAGG